MSKKNWSYLVGAILRPIRLEFPGCKLLSLMSDVYREKLVELDNQSEVAMIREDGVVA